MSFILRYLLYGTIRYDTIRYGTERYGLIRYDTIRYDTVRYGTVRYGTVSYRTVPYRTLENSYKNGLPIVYIHVNLLFYNEFEIFIYIFNKIMGKMTPNAISNDQKREISKRLHIRNLIEDTLHIQGKYLIIQLIFHFMHVTVTVTNLWHRFSRPLRCLFTVLKINFSKPI
jgi:hypothetical protein